MLHAFLKYGAERAAHTTMQRSMTWSLRRSISVACNPVKPFGQTCCRHFSALPQRPGIVRAFDLSHSLVNSLNEQHDGKNRIQVRSLHTSQVLHARSSFAKRVKDKIQKIRQDPNVQQKLVAVGAAGYTVTKFAKAGVLVKYALPALKMTKAMPLMSMGLTTVCYTCFFGFPFAIGIVSTLAAANASRQLFLKRFGCEVETMMMVPFFGTMNSGSNTDYRKTEEYVLATKPFERCLVTLAPVIGIFAFTATVPFGTAGLLFQSQCGYAVASTGFMMGMFSLLPLGDMTPGGRLLNYFSKNALLFGTAFNLALITVLSNPILYLCLVLNLYRLYQRGFTLFGRQFGGDSEATFNDVARGLTTQFFSDNQKLAVASMYWALFILNAGGMMLVGKFLATPKQLRAQQQAEEQERRLNNPDAFPHLADGRFSPPPDSGGWGISDWAMGNLDTLEDMDSDKDHSMEWWEQANLEAARNVPAHERFKYQ